MSDSVDVAIGYGLNLGFSRQIPSRWREWDGVKGYMSLDDYFDAYPGFPALTTVFSGSMYGSGRGQDVYIILCIEQTVIRRYAGQPLVFTPREMHIGSGWDDRLLLVRDAMGIKDTFHQPGWQAMPMFG